VEDLIKKGEFVNNIQSLSVEVPSYKEAYKDGKSVVFFNMVIQSRGNKKWELDKRYSEFDSLDKVLRAQYPSVPNLPGKTLFKLSEAKLIEDRRKALNDYMKTLITRRDMRTCEEFRRFIELEDHIGSKVFEARKIATMTDFK